MNKDYIISIIKSRRNRAIVEQERMLQVEDTVGSLSARELETLAYQNGYIMALNELLNTFERELV